MSPTSPLVSTLKDSEEDGVDCTIIKIKIHLTRQPPIMESQVWAKLVYQTNIRNDFCPNIHQIAAVNGNCVVLLQNYDIASF